jgi:DNA transformation protein
MSESGLVDHAKELLSPMGLITSRRMFGGHALYIDGLCMALIIRDVLYLKADDTSRPIYEQAGCTPFTYEAKNQEIHSLGYYTAPDEAMESPAEMTPWARRALAAAVAKRAQKPAAKKKSAPAKKAATKKPAAAKKTTKPAAPRKAAKS